MPKYDSQDSHHGYASMLNLRSTEVPEASLVAFPREAQWIKRAQRHCDVNVISGGDLARGQPALVDDTDHTVGPGPVSSGRCSPANLHVATSNPDDDHATLLSADLLATRQAAALGCTRHNMGQGDVLEVWAGQ